MIKNKLIKLINRLSDYLEFHSKPMLARGFFGLGSVLLIKDRLIKDKKSEQLGIKILFPKTTLI